MAEFGKEGSADKKQKVVDVSSARSQLWATVRDLSATTRSKLLADMSTAAHTLLLADPSHHGEIFITPVEQRLQICTHFLGNKCISEGVENGVPKTRVETVDYTKDKDWEHLKLQECTAAASDKGEAASDEGTAGTEGAKVAASTEQAAAETDLVDALQLELQQVQADRDALLDFVEATEANVFASNP